MWRSRAGDGADGEGPGEAANEETGEGDASVKTDAGAVGEGAGGGARRVWTGMVGIAGQTQPAVSAGVRVFSSLAYSERAAERR